jgi:hypothetical protein
MFVTNVPEAAKPKYDIAHKWQYFVLCFRRELRSWITRSVAESDVSNRRRAVDAILALVLAIGPTALGLAVSWRWLAWIVCWALVVGYVLPDWFPVSRQFPAKTKRVVFVFAILSFAGGFWPLAHRQWIQEQSEQLSGDLVPQGPFQATEIIVEFGNSGRMMPWRSSVPSGDLKLMYDAGIHLALGEKGIELTTAVRDSEGQQVVTVDKNHWAVSRFPVVTDKNYTKDSLEVLDRRGHVVLQVRILPDRIQLAGEWRDDLGRGIRITTCHEPTCNCETGCLQSWIDRASEIRLEGLISPQFLYPSKDHWRERVKSPW